MTEKAEIAAKFKKIYGNGEEPAVFFSPGRVNLIGEHTDYNGGHVFPCALTIGTYGAVCSRSDRTLRLYSENMPSDGILSFSLDDPLPASEKTWAKYFLGILRSFADRGCTPDFGADIFVCGDLPIGGGLSSSSSIEILAALMLRSTCSFRDLTMKDLALIGMDTENNYIGMSCGIMDPFTISMGRKNHAIFLDTSNMNYEYEPLAMDGLKLVISNTNVSHDLAREGYAKRRAECAEAIHDLSRILPIHHLCDILGEQFEAYKTCIPDPTVRMRAKHVIYENQRTIQANSALKSGNLERFGRLMRESHLSLRDDFQVSCPELDFLAEEAWKNADCIGSRMTGGGYGGCTVSFVKEAGVQAFIDTLGSSYQEKFDKKADFYIVDIGDGAHALL